MDEILADNSYIIGEVSGIFDDDGQKTGLATVELITRKRIIVSDILIDKIKSSIGEQVVIMRERGEWLFGVRK